MRSGYQENSPEHLRSTKQPVGFSGPILGTEHRFWVDSRYPLVGIFHILPAASCMSMKNYLVDLRKMENFA